MSTEVNFLYPLFGSVSGILTGSFALFSPFLRKESEFKNEINWHLSLLRGKKIDKLREFVSKISNERNIENLEEQTSTRCYLEDIYANIIDHYDIIDELMRKLIYHQKQYCNLHFGFMISILFAIVLILLSIICNTNQNLYEYFYIIFVFSIFLICIQIILILILRHHNTKCDEIISDRLFKDKNDEIRTRNGI